MSLFVTVCILVLLLFFLAAYFFGPSIEYEKRLSEIEQGKKEYLFTIQKRHRANLDELDLLLKSFGKGREPTKGSTAVSGKAVDKPIGSEKRQSSEPAAESLKADIAKLCTIQSNLEEATRNGNLTAASEAREHYGNRIAEIQERYGPGKNLYLDAHPVVPMPFSIQLQ
jgi:hypothetical protein